MLKQLLATTAVILALSAPAWADDAAPTTDSQTIVPPPAETEAGATMETDTGEAEAGAEATDAAAAPAEETAPAAEETTVTEEAPAEPIAEEPVAEEMATEEAPAEEATDGTAARAVPGAVIEAQAEDQLRADELIGLTVVSADGQEVGEVYDLIFDQEKLTGIVVGMGGFLGIGEKLVGVNWTQAELQTDPESAKEQIFVGLTATDLEAAPDFMTKQELQSEADAEAAAAAAAAAQPEAGALEPAPEPTTE
jgi:sporulation protein YlmC with PRC-barrel domain